MNTHNGIALFPLFYLLTIHFIADFIAQSDEMARGKSKSNYFLLYHVGVYTFIFLVALSPAGIFLLIILRVELVLNSLRNKIFIMLSW